MESSRSCLFRCFVPELGGRFSSFLLYSLFPFPPLLLDNKLAMKLFGSKKALMDERARQKESGLFIIHPCSTFR